MLLLIIETKKLLSLYSQAFVADFIVYRGTENHILAAALS